MLRVIRGPEVQRWNPMARLTYSFVSAFLKIGVFVFTVLTAYRVNDATALNLGPWVTVPFVCFAILGTKCAGEAVDGFVRRKIGYTVTNSDD
ncbi:hypothetical protein SPHV1_420037 [Novosphingobium sp. KN65.2]|nr:hypothetical protein SPHV1_420037 [Novosphingobium sp. KN65.2]